MIKKKEQVREEVSHNNNKNEIERTEERDD